ncbi:glucuronate isomerase [Stieleria sp. JC731]|uniref:glucuronate isomerase n=1 Tax=Pirellulaceae TaxID=2691357 RepID=UPI001E3A5166|nr:glucuronate isomerase [Stieleria sp. JC731]MCC9599770.1 glucuronate isomerase [Stieleria sp. JC731]
MAAQPARDLSSARETIYQAISAIRLVDPHTHINPHSAGSQTLADILGYHYYTELVHSAGMPRLEIEEPGIEPRELVRRMVHGLGNITNTANYHWLIQICREFFDFTDDAITPDNWEELYDRAEAKMGSPDWAQTVLDHSNVEAVFLTNDFDDDLEGFDTSTYIPCLRTDDLVFHLAKPEVQERLEKSSGVSLNGSLGNLRDALRQRFIHFVTKGARACAISIPPSFQPSMVSDGRAQKALQSVLTDGVQASAEDIAALSKRVFWTLAELCDEFGLPFDLMIGVNRGVYPGGVFQGQDLYDSRVSLIQYRELFNAFPRVKFPVSVLASVTNQELVSYSWIFPNVITNGHWWYSNTPSFIHRDAAARLEAVPRNKQIGYYSDAYKLEFVLPKFDMYRRILSRVLADEFVGENGWSEEKAIELGRQVLRGNVDDIFRAPPELDLDAIKAGAASIQLVSTDDEGDDGLDPVPNEEEIEGSGVRDVYMAELGDRYSATTLDAEIDAMPLDVGDLLGDENPSGPDAPGSQIHPITGDGEFTPDSDTMMLRPDPMTGELHFPVDEDEKKSDKS